MLRTAQRPLEGVGGTIRVKAGHGTTSGGGRVVFSAGEVRRFVADATGGAVPLITGFGAVTSSGSFSLRTSKAGAQGVSGAVSFATGTTSKGSSGNMMVGTGSATKGTGGSLGIVGGIRQHLVHAAGASPCQRDRAGTALL